jgi:hypothetical protein
VLTHPGVSEPDTGPQGRQGLVPTVMAPFSRQRNLLAKLGLADRVQIVSFAHESGLVKPGTI